VTEVGTTRVAVAATATATALVVGVVGVVLAVDDRRRAASNVTIPSPSSPTPNVAQSQATPKPTPRVPQPAPLLLPNMRSLSVSDLQIEVVGNTRPPPRSPTSDLGRYSCCPGAGANARQDSMRQSSWCIAMSIGMGSFSAPATGNCTGE
jgi:hypothetical protein